MCLLKEIQPFFFFLLRIVSCRPKNVNRDIFLICYNAKTPTHTYIHTARTCHGYSSVTDFYENEVSDMVQYRHTVASRHHRSEQCAASPMKVGPMFPSH